MELNNLMKEKESDDFLNNLTVAFSAYNILEYLKLSINSFLDLYPELKPNLLVFDDESTDGTKEWLEKEGIRRITWSEEYKQERDLHYSAGDTSLIYRVGLIMNDIFSQVKTKYLLLNDGDVVFIDPFLERYEALISLNYKVILCKDKHGKEILDDDRYSIFKNKLKYEILISPNEKYLFRAHQFHGLYDLEYLKSKNILHDRVFNPWVEQAQSLTPPISDTGLDFLYLLEEQKIKYYDLEYLSFLLDNPIYHFGFISSQRRLGIEIKDERTYTPFLEESAKHIVSRIEKFDKDIAKRLKGELK